MRNLFLSKGHDLGQNYPFWPKDQGATGNGTTEFAEVKKVVDGIASVWIPGVNLIVVPEGLNLSQRCKWINQRCVDGDVCLEFHLDAWPATARGASVWYMAGSSYAQNEGVQFLQQYTSVTGLPSRHVNPDTADRLWRLGFVRDTKPMALLIELGFVSNSIDLQVIRSTGIVAAISSIKKMLWL